MRRVLSTCLAAVVLLPVVPASTDARAAALSGSPSASASVESGPAVATVSHLERSASADRPRYRATVRWTRHGIPHVTARSFGSLGFGSGYAAAESSVCTLADTLVTGRGERSRWFGPRGRYDDQVSMNGTNLQIDTLVTDLRDRRVVERLLRSKAGPEPRTRALVAGYVAGLNRWLRTHRVTDPACRGAGYLRPDVTRLDLYYGVYLANLLASTGVFVKEIADADPPTLADPGLPELPLNAADFTAAQRDRLLAALGRDPDSPFGSNATAIGGDSSSTGRGMLLGNPHFPWRGRYRFTQQHLTIPGRYDVAGASLIGSPAVNIGWNRDVAWSHTVSTAYRFTPYEYRLVDGATRYLSGTGVRELERRVVKVKVRGGDGRVRTVREDLWRTPQGYVVDSPATLMGWTAASVWAIRDANAEHLRTIDTFLDMGAATSVRDLLRRQDAGGGMPWVNTTAADRSGQVVYADHSVVPHVTNAKKERCLTVVGRVLDQVAGLPGLDGTTAGGRCAWGTDKDAQRPGILGPRRLPEAFRRDWGMNANDSYWLPNPKQRLEGFPTIMGCERCERTMRTRMVSQYVIDRLRRGKETPTSLASHQYANRLRAAEVMRVGGDLDRACAATGEQRACAVLRRWDGRSDATSVGTQLFEAFVARLPDQGVWEVPFDARQPLTTPRDLNEANPAVVQAMRDAVADLRRRGVRLDASWGRLQVAGDRGAPPLALGGGTGDAVGNANALASRRPGANRDRYRPITYGSSHIQAIAFLDGGRVSARTVLTYGQDEDPRSRYAADQTRLFSRERWVRFPFSADAVRRQTVRTERLTG
ncbi:penicillin acylase family protein [Nocardioides marinquilinus]|uniref:Penicillin acylase family protein n=1 Tax=Nocardioides marinquilinus TaxID=1210400 RepID=A0ABP9Q516_9ACTN